MPSYEGARRLAHGLGVIGCDDPLLYQDVEAAPGYTVEDHPFEDITSPDDLILKGHFSDFRLGYAPEVSPQTNGMAFNSTVDVSNLIWTGGAIDGLYRFDRQRHPLTGLELRRISVFVPEFEDRGKFSVYSQIARNKTHQLACFAIVAGTFANGREAIEAGEIDSKGPKVKGYLLKMMDHIEKQIQ